MVTLLVEEEGRSSLGWWLALGPVEQLVPGRIEVGHWSFLCVPVTWCAVVNMVIIPAHIRGPATKYLVAARRHG